MNITSWQSCLTNQTNELNLPLGKNYPALVETSMFLVPNYLAFNISTKYETEQFNIGTFVFDYYNVFLVYLNHNGTLYGTSSSTGTYTGLSGTWYNKTLTAPSPDIGYGNATVFYNWSILLTNGTWINSSMLNYTSFAINMSNCSVNASLRYLLYNEEVPSQKITSNFSIQLEYNYGGIVNRNFSGNYTGMDNYSFCIYPNTINLTVDAYAKFQNATYLNRHYLSNYLASNITTNLSLYLLPPSITASDLILTVRNKDTYNYYNDIYVQLQRKYIGEGVWRTVQMTKTDQYGKGYFKVKELNEDYRFIFSDADNNVLETSNSISLLCSAALCDITYLVDSTPEETARNTAIYHTFNNATGILTIYFNEPSGESIQFDSRVTRVSSLVNTQLCAESSYGSFGIQTCNLSGLTGMFSITATTTASPNMTSYASILEISQPRGLGHNLSFAEQAFWSIAIILTFVGIALFSPIAALLSGSVGVIIIYQLGMISGLTIAVIVAIFLLVAFVAYKVQE
jgi:hypothetical protein